MLQIGSLVVRNRVWLAPMAGISDWPFRRLAWRLGAGHVVAEMTAANKALWNSPRSLERRQAGATGGLHAIQIAGSDPVEMADAARLAVDAGADLIDINMGCPAKKVCNRMAGSALLQDETLVGRILAAVVAAVDVPVTLKTRAGWSPERRNAPTVARIAEETGIAALVIHGRTRACRFKGAVEYRTIRRVVDSVSIPVIANGDIVDAETARRVLEETGAAGVMIGRAALGAPWLPGQIAAGLADQDATEPEFETRRSAMLDLVDGTHSFYGERRGVRIIRKQANAFLEAHGASRGEIRHFHSLESATAQLAAIGSFEGVHESTLEEAV